MEDGRWKMVVKVQGAVIGNPERWEMGLDPQFFTFGGLVRTLKISMSPPKLSIKVLGTSLVK
jgi:hypothetical protein